MFILFSVLGAGEKFLDRENYVFSTGFRGKSVHLVLKTMIVQFFSSNHLVTDEMRRERIISSNLFEEEHFTSQQ